ncbi:MAG: GNAT family N-acetyltransferase, partial [Patescibacteria group bacterium]|nr:GNAT family N-acetyltransferase [Patescibacteria group bacterium]
MVKTIIQYKPEKKTEWDNFVAKAKNGVFLFFRDYMDYHKDRFHDYSLMAYDESGSLVGVLPANLENDVLHTHAGLTFGGWLIGFDMTITRYQTLFEAWINYLRVNSILKVIYKCIPHIYHQVPAQEDLYLMFSYDAKVVRRDVTTVIDLNHKLPYSERKKRVLRKAFKNELSVEKSNNYRNFWPILENVLETRYGKKPVHTVEEIEKLAHLFPRNIHLFLANRKNEALAGAVIYE